MNELTEEEWYELLFVLSQVSRNEIRQMYDRLVDLPDAERKIGLAAALLAKDKTIKRFKEATKPASYQAVTIAPPHS